MDQTQGRSQRLYHVEAHQKENWIVKRYLTYFLYFSDSEKKVLIRLCGRAGWSAPFVICKQQSQGFSRRYPYDVAAQASWPPPGYAPETYKHHYEKANQTLGFLKRNIQVHKNDLKSVVRPQLEYASAVWYPTPLHI